ncbi:MAG: DNA-directed polymerase subunit [Candidatus Woesearchaeota archaeon]|nr:DNA-directed polymerase subunit [Candidatus Woesearchaeota archaeon]MDN5327412.1 DNA-directed polymerase subunit [Candidatus Woesearchaeota archaeon]
MNINIISESKDEIIFTLEGADHTVLNLLKDELYAVDGVLAASYNVTHPLVKIPKVIVKTNGKVNPRDAIKSAIQSAKKKLSDFKKQVGKLS